MAYLLIPLLFIVAISDCLAEEALLAFQQGRFQQAITQWQQQLSTVQQPTQRIDILIYLANAHRALGLSGQALANLKTALRLAQETKAVARQVTILVHLSELYRARQFDDAIAMAKTAVITARSLNQPLLLATALNQFSTVLADQPALIAAWQVYRDIMPFPSLSLQPIPDIDALKQKLNALNAQPDSSDKVIALLRLGQAAQQAQHHPPKPLMLCEKTSMTATVAQPYSISTILAIYQKAADLAEQLQVGSLQALALGQLGQGYIALTRHTVKATALFQQAVFFARLDLYQQAIHLAKRVQHAQLIRTGLLNILQLAQDAIKQASVPQVTPIAQAYWSQAVRSVEQSTDTHEKALNWLTLGDIGATLQQEVITTCLKPALQLAEQLADARLQSFAYGQLGHAYETQAHFAEALALTRQALFWAQQAQAPESLYRWHWQLGRLLKRQGYQAIASSQYQHAVTQLEKIRPLLVAKPSSVFEQEVAPVYFDWIGLLLEHAEKTAGTEQQAVLRQTQVALEQLKTIEIENYFQDDCVTLLQAQKTVFDTALPPKTAVLYPLLSSDYLTLLVQLPQRRVLIRIQVDERAVNSQINRFLAYLETDSAYKLYQWLIAPLADRLQAIDTLVIVPTGVFYRLPFAALYDGQHYLIENYAVATTPGLTLTPAGFFQADEVSALLGGLTVPISGLPQLCHVPKELNTIHELYGGHFPLENQNFITDNIATALHEKSYDVIHFATHGEFSSIAQQSFIAAYDHNINLNQLEQWLRKTSVELLTLSACQTAQGDSARAALGLAGVAVKAGARSALASLWSVNDEATAVLLPEFYRQWQKNRLSKAQALQAAQKHLLTLPAYQHPRLWAAFLLIGNWQ